MTRTGSPSAPTCTPGSTAGALSSAARETAGDGVTGYAFGAPLPAGSGWWNSAADPLPEDFTDEDGQRTFAVFAVMVRRPWRGTGEAHRLSEWLLHGRPEQRATLLVDASHPGCGGATSTGAATLSATGSPSPAPRSAR